MTYATLLVNLGLGRSNASLLRAVGAVARRFDASVVAIAVAEPLLINYGDGVISGDAIEQGWESTLKDTRQAEAECRGLLGTQVRSLEWRATSDYRSISEQVASLASIGDLILTGMTTSRLGGGPRGAGAGDIVMQAGRPVLVVPELAHEASLDRVVMAWKDTREARRAASDAIPLLKAAAHVTVIEVAGDDEIAAARLRLNDVAGWLKRHAVAAETLALTSDGDDGTRLNDAAKERGAGVFVAGAYGHSRFNEWALGGVTRDLLLRTNLCSLLSH